MRYQIGDGVTQDADEAYRLHCLAAEKGNYHSDYQIYSEFRGKDEPETMQQHKEKAIAGYQRLAKKHPDDPEIYWRLAMLHSEGIGVDSSENTIAVNYLRKAAALGHEDARETLPQYTTAR
jgi:TPR repeat protein